MGAWPRVPYDRAASATRDLPQASSLAKVRGLVEAVAAGHGASARAAGDAVGLSARHAAYYAAAASVTLGLVALGGRRLVLTESGRALLATPAGSLAERDALATVIRESTSIGSIAPDLLDGDGPSREALTRRLFHAGLSEATARRRASTLLSWRRYVQRPEVGGGSPARAEAGRPRRAQP